MKKLNKLTIVLAVMVLTITAINAQTYVDYKITTWNVEWLSCLNYGPKDRERQINNVVAVIKEMNSDIVALQEVGTGNAYKTIDTLVKRLGNEWDGHIVPWDNNNCSQNQGIVYKKSKIQLISSLLITNGGSAYNWSSGRYPVLYDVDLTTEKNRIPVAFINIHAKAYSDEQSYMRRRDASIALDNYLKSTVLYNQGVVIIGDYNDYLIGTTCSSCGGISPYKNFIDDGAHYKGLTAELIDPYYHNSTIDNIIISYKLFNNYLNNSVFIELPATQIIPNYRNTTSDHYPISVTLRINEEVSITDLPALNDIKVYPNPASYELQVTSYELQVNSIEIFDIYGRKQSSHHHIITSSHHTIDISHLQPGFYFVKIKTDFGEVVKKVVKQ